MTAIRNEELTTRIQTLANENPSWGYLKITAYLKGQGFTVNHKRVQRIYRELGLLLRTHSTRRDQKATSKVWSPQPGVNPTIISGTLRNEDLIPAFANELERLDTEGEHKVLLIEARGIEDFDGEHATWAVGELHEALNTFAPEGFYFGAHFGDGSSYGFWKFD